MKAEKVNVNEALDLEYSDREMLKRHPNLMDPKTVAERVALDLCVLLSHFARSVRTRPDCPDLKEYAQAYIHAERVRQNDPIEDDPFCLPVSIQILDELIGSKPSPHLPQNQDW